MRTSNGQMKFGKRKSDGALLSWGLLKGGLAQLARAPALQAGGQRFESVILHFKQSIGIINLIRLIRLINQIPSERKKSTLTYWKRVRSRVSGGRQTRANQKSQIREAQRRCKAEAGPSDDIQDETQSSKLRRKDSEGRKS